MIAMTYGELPTLEAFSQLFANECPDGTYPISHGSQSYGEDRPPAGSYTDSELYVECQRLLNLETDSAEMWVSDILYSLGIEWI